jgi:RHH-type rel operon transcriptional repressor/antitoxin RelB
MGKNSASIALPQELERRLAAIASAGGIRPQDIALQAIEEFVSDMEDARIAEERLEALRVDSSGTVSLEELMARHGVAD